MTTPHVLSLVIEQQHDGVTVASETVCKTLESGPNFKFIVESSKIEI